MEKNLSSPGRRGIFIFIVAGVAALAGLLFGYDTGVISGAILFIHDQFKLTAALEETVVSATLLGAVIGAAASGLLADRFGRRKMIIVTALIFSVGAIGAAVSKNVYELIAFRVLIGVAIGVASYTAPLYISEISPHKMRGALVSLNQLMITCGIVVSYVIDYVLANYQGWRWMFAFGAIPALVLLVGMLALTDSPRWLVTKNRLKEAKAILLRIHTKERAEHEIHKITKTITKRQASWKELLSPYVRPALIAGIGLAFFQQLTGINTIIYYAPTIFEFAGFESHKVSILATIGVGVVNVAMTVVAIWLLDKIGRKPLLYVGMAGMVASLTALGIFFNMQDLSSTLKMATVISVMIYIASFAISLGPIFWLIIAEIYPLKIRGRAMSIATVANWGFNMIVAATFLTLTQKLGKSGTFFLYAAVALIGIVFCYFWVPETKGKTLEEIEESFYKAKSA